MNAIKMLEEEHRNIERELLELEAIMEAEEINYSNLNHVFERLHNLWNSHEEKEAKIFQILKNEEIKMPVDKMMFEHSELSMHRKAMMAAIKSGSEINMKKALNSNGKIIIEKLRRHMEDEEGILFLITMDLFTPEELEALANLK